MSEFSSEGHDSFPNFYADRESAKEVATWEADRLNYKIGQYTEFIVNGDPMPRALKAANTIIDLLMFELAYRDGVYDEEAA